MKCCRGALAQIKGWRRTPAPPKEPATLLPAASVVLETAETRLRRSAAASRVSVRRALNAAADGTLVAQLRRLGTCSDAPRSDFARVSDLAHGGSLRRKHVSARGIHAPADISLQTTAANPDDIPPATRPEVCFCGQSNSGKSRLINALAQSQQASVKHLHGHTRALHFYQLGQAHAKTAPNARIYGAFVDMPGYGFALASEAERAVWSRTVEAYLASRARKASSSSGLRRVFVLVDGRLGLRELDIRLMEQVFRTRLPFQVVLTKCDLVPASELAARIRLVEAELAPFAGVALPEPLPVSSATEAGVAQLRRIVYRCWGFQRLPQPRDMPSERSAALEAARKRLRDVAPRSRAQSSARAHLRRLQAAS